MLFMYMDNLCVSGFLLFVSLETKGSFKLIPHVYSNPDRATSAALMLKAENKVDH